MDVSQSASLEECLLELLDPNTTPEKALESFSYTCFSPEHYPQGAKQPVVIFLAYMRFIVTRLPDACVDVIWEDIFRKTVIYSQNCSFSGLEIAQARRIFPTIVPADSHKEITWLRKSLKYLNNCPNPYTRLELFRLIRIFKNSSPCIDWSRTSIAFMHTICDIQPLSLHSNGVGNTLVFGFLDFNYIIDKCWEYEYEDILVILSESPSEVSVETISMVPRFISHCFQLLGFFANSASLLSHSKTQLRQIQASSYLFHKMVIELKSSWRQFDYLLSCPCTIETICDITAAIINNKSGDKKKGAAVNIRDNIIKELDINTKPWDLPKLLASRQIQNSVWVHQCTLLNGNLPHQIQASVLVHQHTLLLRNLQQLYKNIDANTSYNYSYYGYTDDSDISDDISDPYGDYEDTDDEEIDEDGDEEEDVEAMYEEIDTEVSEADNSDIEDNNENDY